MKYIPALDGVRGIAVLAVFLNHTYLLLGGFYGVDVFFTLSGFLITSLLLDEHQQNGAISLKSFYMRRALRLLPALVVVMLACALYESLYRPVAVELSLFARALAVLFYYGNWVMAHDDLSALGPLSPTWSLAIEEQFYLLWPFALKFLLKKKTKPGTIAAILCLMIGVSIAARLGLSSLSLARVYCGSDTHADPILIGCLLAVLLSITPASSRQNRRLSMWIAPLFLCGLFYVFWRFSILGRTPFHFGYTTVALLTSGLIVMVMLERSPAITNLLEWPPLVWFGKISYGLYLWHGAAFFIAEAHFPNAPTVLSASIGLALAVASYYFIERPALRFKDRVAQPKASAV